MEQQKQGSKMSWGRFVAMIVVSTIVMFPLELPLIILFEQHLGQ